ncbi:MAG: archaemetzincin family Zn-dependent metalloprotease, partial [Promethearchaeota archaeon]
ILIQEIGNVNQNILLRLKKNLEWSFKGIIKKVKKSKKAMPLFDSFYNGTRKQYDASLLLSLMKYVFSQADYTCVLGVLEEDIYSRTMNFIFGIAERACYHYAGFSIISICRLRESFYGRKVNPSLLELRVLKEVIHEIGHVFGLGHCQNKCVMVFSEKLVDTDNKPPNYCHDCTASLQNHIDRFLIL